ncbi:NADPH-dependent FMN reductase [Beutenbergia cavernae DSM 12333]|uniref:NADPH-dependent FMN reductase n=1 Tax=Beutenbergia cavernae (strain ATCC BAA-8 / DSM 12333 / CCUG 43141 / JCM 11478 / NBRC 16432 / NCIMB 13614 / HKI 0122) TaxID=471853 RepID=C5C468_BEUC1|nr:CE1759 family FMN reductase [Beutenbergia cavernae]ACQ79981.1 NADPH-dependent FMN reductase [Beutenbergia cavernae DSM 12333]
MKTQATSGTGAAADAGRRPVRLVALSGGLGYPSSTRTLTDLLTSAVADRLAGDGQEVLTTTVEVRDVAQDAVAETLLGLRSEPLAAALAEVEDADALIVASPVFRGSYAGVFKAVVDLLDPLAMRGKPVLLAATSGSARHTLMADHALRPLMSYFGTLTVPTAVVATPEEFAFGTRPVDGLRVRIDRAADELADLTRVRVRARSGA